MSNSNEPKPTDPTPLAGNIPAEPVDLPTLAEEPPKSDDKGMEDPLAPKSNERIIPVGELNDSTVEVEEQPTLPQEVLAAQKIDRDRYKKSQTTAEKKEDIKPVDPKAPQKPMDKIKAFFKKDSNLLKVLLIIPACFIGFFIMLLLAYLANVDTAIFKITMKGQVTDVATSQPVAGAVVSINGVEKATTNDNGDYQISNLNSGVADVGVQADGYDDLTESIAITRGFLAYSFTHNFTLTSSELATVSGTLIPNTGDHDFASDKLFLNDKEYKIKPDGTFVADDVVMGEMVLKFSSISFKEVEKTYTIKAGSNKLEDITLDPAGDITGELKAYVNEDLVLGTQFNIENVEANQVEIKDDGNFTIKDLEVAKEYKIKVVADGYKTRDYELTIKQGENKIFNFKLVENFTAAFTRKVSDKIQLFVSDLDGANSEQLTNISQSSYAINSWFLNTSENKIYFLSDYENIHSVSQKVRLAYSIDLTNNQQTKLTTDTSNLGNIFSNFRAKKLINIIASNSIGTGNQQLQTMDLAGGNRKDIKSVINAAFPYAILSDSGNYIFFTQNDAGNAGYYRVNINSGDSKTISQIVDIRPYDSTADGERTIFSRKNTSTGFNDLALYTFNDSETRILDENLDGLDYQFIKGSDDQILYYATRSGKSDIYKFTISENKDEKVTNLGSDQNIRDIYQNGKYLFYYTNKGLYVLDITKPKDLKLITASTVIP